jgi:hypothetical protein
MKKLKTKRQRLLRLLKRSTPIWRDEDHPELKDGAAAFVRKMRALDEVRFQKIQEQRDRA